MLEKIIKKNYAIGWCIFMRFLLGCKFVVPFFAQEIIEIKNTKNNFIRICKLMIYHSLNWPFPSFKRILYQERCTNICHVCYCSCNYKHLNYLIPFFVAFQTFLKHSKLKISWSIACIATCRVIYSIRTVHKHKQLHSLCFN